MCRFTQEDPAKDGLNWYAYCGNNPVNFVDPWGLMINDILNSKNISEHYSDDYVQFAERVFTESIMKTVTTTNPITIVENSSSIIIYAYICLRTRS